MLIGWDFDMRIRLEPTKPVGNVPDRLGRFLSTVTRQRPELNAYVLKWDMAMAFALGREIVPMFILKWLLHRNVHFELDSHHPTGACHHQKIVVIDDAMAFCGAIDMTDDRWDTRAHRDDDPHRRRPSGRRYGPFHDVTTAVDGAAAKALGDLARERWWYATGERLDPPRSNNDPWPDGLTPMIRDVDVAIARSQPFYDGQPEVREIEALYRDAIAAARRTIYLESQYLASFAIAEALADRLREPDGPEVVVINPLSAAGWLEEKAMDSARSRIIRMLHDAGGSQRFRIYTPVTEGGAPIYVHAKIVAIDDRLLRIGSSNLNNRSMGFDTECDLAFEAVPGTAVEAELRRFIPAFRDDLLAEHLGVRPDDVTGTRQRTGSLLQAIEGLRRDTGRTLHVIEPEPLNDAKELIVETRLLDPEKPQGGMRRLKHRLKALWETVTPSFGNG
jgi:phospholipase D1/2